MRSARRCSDDVLNHESELEGEFFNTSSKPRTERRAESSPTIIKSRNIGD
jgi:hypothetical protein